MQPGHGGPGGQASTAAHTRHPHSSVYRPALQMVIRCSATRCVALAGHRQYPWLVIVGAGQLCHVGPPMTTAASWLGRSSRGARRGRGRGECSPAPPCSVTGHLAWGECPLGGSGNETTGIWWRVHWCTAGLMAGAVPVGCCRVHASLPSGYFQGGVAAKRGVLSGPATAGPLRRDHPRRVTPPWTGRARCRSSPSVVPRSPNVIVSAEGDQSWADQPETGRFMMVGVVDSSPLRLSTGNAGRTDVGPPRRLSAIAVCCLLLSNRHRFGPGDLRWADQIGEECRG